MGPLVTFSILFSNLFNLNSNDSIFKQIFTAPVSFFKSFSTPSSTPYPIQIRNTKSYTIALVGDSMIEVLGSADSLREDLKYYYPKKEFGILNFGIGSTSILSLPKMLQAESKRGDETLPPILATRPDIILIESFGNNPLSQFPLKEGLEKQREALDQTIKIIKEKQPNAAIVFIATISPSKQKYGQGVIDLSSEQREKWVEERIAYIKNHIDYAKSHKIPLVNIYESSLTDTGDGREEYLNSSDYIHPSSLGIEFISQQIADFIFREEIITN